MPLFLVERNYAEQWGMTDDERRRAEEYMDVNDITWLTSFLSADKKKTYCLYEVDDAEILRKHAADLGFPADVIVEVSEIPR